MKAEQQTEIVEPGSNQGSRWLGFLDEFYTLRIDVLSKFGLLGEAGAEVRWKWRSGSEVTRARWSPDTRRLMLETFDHDERDWSAIPTRADAASIEVVEHRDQHGRRVYFLCPIDGRDCKALFLVKGRWGSREALNLRHRSASLSRLKRAMRKRENGGTLPPYIPHDPFLVSPPAQTYTSPSPRRPGDNMWSTKFALNNAASIPAAQRVALQDTLLEGAKMLRVVGSDPLPPTSMRNSLLEYYPRLELDTLVRCGLVREGERTAFTLTWERGATSRPTTLDIVVCEICLIDPNFPHILVVSATSRRPFINQLIRLSPPDKSPRKRRAFICPVTGKKVFTLAFRDDRWASRLAQNLRHESQRSGRFKGHVANGYRDD